MSRAIIPYSRFVFLSSDDTKLPLASIESDVGADSLIIFDTVSRRLDRNRWESARDESEVWGIILSATNSASSKDETMDDAIVFEMELFSLAKLLSDVFVIALIKPSFIDFLGGGAFSSKVV